MVYSQLSASVDSPNHILNIAFDLQLGESVYKKPKDMKGQAWIYWKNLCIKRPTWFKPLLFKGQLNFISEVGIENYSNKLLQFDMADYLKICNTKWRKSNLKIGDDKMWLFNSLDHVMSHSLILGN